MNNANWKKVKLEEIVENLDNMRIPVTKSKRNKGTIPYYGATGVVDYVDNYIFDERLLLIGEDGADWSPYAKSAYVIEGKSWVNNHAHVLRASGIDIEYLKEYLNYSDLRLHTSGTTRGKLNKSDLMNIQVPLPSKQVQEKISAILTSISNEITKTYQIIQKTEDLKQGLMQSLLSKGKKYFIKQVTNVKRGASPRPIADPKFFAEKGRGWIRIADVTSSYKQLNFTSQYLSKAGEDASVKVDPGDLIMSICATVGKPIFVNIPACIHDGFVVFRNLDITLVDPEYFFYALLHNEKLLRSKGQTGSQMNLNSTIVENTELHFPDLDEQKKIAEILRALDQKLDEYKRENEKLQTIKMGLMHDIFSQKININ